MWSVIAPLFARVWENLTVQWHCWQNNASSFRPVSSCFYPPSFLRDRTREIKPPRGNEHTLLVRLSVHPLTHSVAEKAARPGRESRCNNSHKTRVCVRKYSSTEELKTSDSEYKNSSPSAEYLSRISIYFSTICQIDLLLSVYFAVRDRNMLFRIRDLAKRRDVAWNLNQSKGPFKVNVNRAFFYVWCGVGGGTNFEKWSGH